MCRLVHVSVRVCGTHRGVRCLYSVLVRDGGVHVNKAQKVEAQRRSQTTKQPEYKKNKGKQPNIVMQCEKIRINCASSLETVTKTGNSSFVQQFSLI